MSTRFKDLKRRVAPCLPSHWEAGREARRNRRGPGQAQPDRHHLLPAAEWLARAQDATPDGGVSRGYSASPASAVGYRGWEPSYPETTGYIIPTMFALSEALERPDFADRALKMADWEIDVQMPNGAVMGSVVTAPRTPAVFNTGQVIFGWLSAYERSRSTKYLEAARRAGNFLLSIQDDAGTWSRGDSHFARRGATLYNTRVAWALVLLGMVLEDETYVSSAKRFISYALNRQHSSGWFPENCLNDPTRPLLHTIAYATRGVLEVGILLGEARYLDAAGRVLDALQLAQRADGGLPGRFDEQWCARAGWDCLTGDAQVSVAWLRADAARGQEKYSESVRRLLNFLKGAHRVDHPNPGIRGGVMGSFPFDGEYGRYEVLNWGTKFLCDALILNDNRDLSSKNLPG